tara:strand:- start:1002 stop:1271 length:270 start_codon:yes stop_codon:yes gene_type:complete
MWLKVIEFVEHNDAEPMTEIVKPLVSANMHEIVEHWYADFINIEQEEIFELILAANNLSLKKLLDLSCTKIASKIKGKTPEEIREAFNI